MKYLLGLLSSLLLLASLARADGVDNFVFSPSDVQVSFALPSSFAPMAPSYSGIDGTKFYDFGDVTPGPLVLHVIFEADYVSGKFVGTGLAVPMTWTGPPPPPFDVMGDSIGEHQQFAASIFDLDAAGNLISFNPGDYGATISGQPLDGLVITATTPEPSTELLLGVCLFASTVILFSRRLRPVGGLGVTLHSIDPGKLSTSATIKSGRTSI